MHLHNPIRHSTLTAYKHNRYFQTRRGYINWYLSFLGIRSQRNILIEQQVHPNLQIQRFVMGEYRCGRTYFLSGSSSPSSQGSFELSERFYRLGLSDINNCMTQ